MFLGREPGPERVEQVEAMLERMAHRGPDGRHAEARARAVLGHARLAIIDLVTGDQPQSDESGRIRVVVNGEIYNYVELRERLEARGHRFRTTSDIEVIPALWREHGQDFVHELRGMFAIALLDEERDELVLVRDRLGKKPLYWAALEDGVAFASELRCLGAVPEIEPIADEEAIRHFMTWQYVPAPWSAWKGVRKVGAGEMVRVKAGTEPVTRRWWDATPAVEDTLGGEELLGRLDSELTEATRIRLRSDVPLVGFLSGGIDSGLVMASATAQNPDLEAITVGFGSAREDERPLTRATASHLGLTLHEEDLTLDVLPTVERVLAHLDEPLGDSSTVPTWLVCEAARRRAKVALSGDGGDESFAGYAIRYGHQTTLERLRRVLPTLVRKPLLGGLAAIWPDRASLPRPLRLKRVLRAAADDLVTAFARDMSIVRDSEVPLLYESDFLTRTSGFDPQDWFRVIADRARGSDALSKLLYVDRHTFLAEGVLAKVDRMSMAHGLEVRSPLLDQEIVALAARVPPGEKLGGGRGKLCLRRLGQRHLPDVVNRGGKKGFAPPLDDWIRGPLAERLQELVLAPDARIAPWFRRSRIETLIAEHADHRRLHGRVLWNLLVLESWCRAHGVRVT